MRKLLVLAILLLITSPLVVAGESGLVSVKSAHSVGKTIDRLDALLKKKGMTVFTRINHASNGKKAGMDLRPTEVLIFGNPKIGTPLMKCAQTVAIDLPQKALAWEDKNGQVWLSYNSPAHLESRHNIEGCDKVLGKVTKALGNFAKGATKP